MFRMNKGFAIAAVVLCSLGLSVNALADFLLPNYNHTVTVKNRTGQTANDLHCEVLHPITGDDPTAPPFPNESHSDCQMDFDGADIPPGGSVPVSWQSKYRTDAMTKAWWTRNGVNIGGIKLPKDGFVLNAYSMGGNNVLVAVDNTTGMPIQYLNLQIYNNIPAGPDGIWFEPDQYLAHMYYGVAVPLFVPMNGVFPPGETEIAFLTITPSDFEYVAGSVELIDPEYPADSALIGLGGMGVLGSTYLCGDANGDGSADVFDVEAFVYATTHGEVDFLAMYPTSNYLNCDTNCDGAVDVFDVDSFVSAVTGAVCDCGY